MSKNSEKIRNGIISLSTKPYEIISGTVVAGSIDERLYTMSVAISNGSTIINGVILNTISGESKGLFVIPKDNSHVIIGSTDGTGEWTLLKVSEIEKLTVVTEKVKFEIDDNGVEMQNDNLAFSMGDLSFKIKSGSESLYKLLQDLIKALTLLTVNTPSGVSAVPNNVADFTTLLTRLDNLLSA